MDKRDVETDQISNLMTLSSNLHSISKHRQIYVDQHLRHRHRASRSRRSRGYRHTLRQERRSDGGRVVLVEIVIDEPEDDRGFSDGRFACEFIRYIMIRVLALFPVLVVVHDERLEQEW